LSHAISRCREASYCTVVVAVVASAAAAEMCRIVKRLTMTSKMPLALIQIYMYFEGVNFSLSGGDETSAPRAKARGPKSRERGWGSWGGARCLSPPARGFGQCCKLSQQCPGRSFGKFEIRCNLKPQNSLQKCLITSKLLQKG